MGNIKETTFDEIWNSEKAEEVRRLVRNCNRQCWMVGSAVPAIMKYIHRPALWVIRNKLRVTLKKKPVLCLPDGRCRPS